MRIVCIGDSLTAGQHCDPPHWPELIGAKAYGVANETTRDAMRRLPTILAENPAADVVLLQFGHNDCNRWDTLNGYRRVPRAEFASNIEEMIDLCRHHGAHGVYVVEPHRTSKGDGYESDRLSYAAAMRSRVWTVRVPVLDEHLLSDGVHLSSVGHRLYADTLRRFLEC